MRLRVVRDASHFDERDPTTQLLVVWTCCSDFAGPVRSLVAGADNGRVLMPQLFMKIPVAYILWQASPPNMHIAGDGIFASSILGNSCVTR